MLAQPQQNMKARNLGKARPLLLGDFHIKKFLGPAQSPDIEGVPIRLRSTTETVLLKRSGTVSGKKGIFLTAPSLCTVSTDRFEIR